MMTEVAVVGIGRTPISRPGVLLGPRARRAPISYSQSGQTLASRSISARQCGRMRTALCCDFASSTVAPNAFFSRCHWNHSLGGKGILDLAFAENGSRGVRWHDYAIRFCSVKDYI